MTKERYLKFLAELLREHYNSIKETGSASSESEQFINGYLTAARTLNVVYQKELNDFAAKLHFDVFNMTVEERKKSLPITHDLADEEEIEAPVTPETSEDDSLDIPTYKRKGVKLKF